jgi:hypothetical protein
MVHDNGPAPKFDIFKKPIALKIDAPRILLADPRIGRPVGDPGVVESFQLPWWG